MSTVGQSTNRENLSDPDVVKVIKRGSTTVTTSLLGAGLYTGSGTVDITDIQAVVANPKVFAWLYGTGGAVATLDEIPRVWFSDSSSLASQLRSSIFTRISRVGASEDQLRLTFLAYADRAETYTIYYMVTTLAVAPGEDLLDL